MSTLGAAYNVLGSYSCKLYGSFSHTSLHPEDVVERGVLFRAVSLWGGLSTTWEASGTSDAILDHSQSGRKQDGEGGEGGEGPRDRSARQSSGRVYPFSGQGVVERGEQRLRWSRLVQMHRYGLH